MGKEDAERIVDGLFACYPEVQVREETREMYIRFVCELRQEEAASAVADLVRSSTHLPTIAAIRREVTETKLGLPSPLEAYQSIFDPSVKPHSLTRYVAEIFGGEYNIRTSDMPGAARSQFLRMYEDIRDEAVRKGKLPKRVFELEAKRVSRADEESVAELDPPWRAEIVATFEALPDEERERRLVRAGEAISALYRLGGTDQVIPKPLLEAEALRELAVENGLVPERQPAPPLAA